MKVPMSGLLRAESIKMLTTRTLLGLTIGAAAVALLGVFSVTMSGEPAAISGALHEQQYFLLASINVSLFAAVLGVRVFTDEVRHGTIVPTLLATPRRTRALVAKVVTGAAFGAVLGTGGAVAMVACAGPLTSLRSSTLRIGADDVGALAGLIATSALWTAIGVGLGAVIRSQVGAIVTVLVWILVVENLGGANLGEAAKYLPGQAGHALATASQAGDLLTPFLGAVVLLVYATITAIAAALLLRTRDIAAG